jgi:hypothetical protein
LQLEALFWVKLLVFFEWAVSALVVAIARVFDMLWHIKNSCMICENISILANPARNDI